jgi:ABC-type uncharacterized transport system involved in gliding motility auxiliary subunit
MKNKGLVTWLFSSLGVVALFVVIVAINALSNRYKTRVDLTEERAYTLSAGTRAILAKLDTPVQIRFYWTRDDNRMPVVLKTYAQHVDDLLGEYKQASHGLVEIQKLDPVPDSDAEDSAKLDNIDGQQTGLESDPIYLGLSVSMLDRKEPIQLLVDDPQQLAKRERLLEYEISRAITRVMTAEKPVVGIMSSLPVAGRQVNPMMMQMGQRGQPAWVLYSELQQDFKVKTVEMNADKIPDDVKVLVVIHPKGITDTAQYAIDQFVLGGGKLIAFLDPQAVLDQASANPMGMGGGSSSNLDKLLKAWGLTFNSTQVVADADYVGRSGEGRQPAVLALTEDAVNKDDIITADATNLLLGFAGAFTGTAAPGLKETVLIKSSPRSQLVDPMSAQFGGEKIMKDLVPSGTEYPLAVRLTGKFKTAFPDGKPKAPEPPPAPDAKPEDKKPDAPAEKGLTESKEETAVVLIGDTDVIQDQVMVQEVQSPLGNGQRMVVPKNGNLAFAQGAIEQLSGDNNLIAVRSRASRERQFTVVNAIQEKAESASQSKIKELETSLQETQTKLNDLQKAKGAEKGQKFILSPEQQEEIVNFRKKEAEVKQQIKEERKKMHADIDVLENTLKWGNIAVMPALVALAGIFLAVVRHQRRAAR